MRGSIRDRHHGNSFASGIASRVPALLTRMRATRPAAGAYSGGACRTSSASVDLPRPAAFGGLSSPLRYTAPLRQLVALLTPRLERLVVAQVVGHELRFLLQQPLDLRRVPADLARRQPPPQQAVPGGAQVDGAAGDVDAGQIAAWSPCGNCSLYAGEGWGS